MNTLPLSQPQSSSFFSPRSIARHLLPTLLENSLPFGIYFLVKGLTGTSDVVALSIGAVVPASLTLWQVLRTRRINAMTLLILLGMLASVLAALLGSDARLLLIRESAVGAVLGLSFLVSLFFSRPLFFVLIRQVRAGRDQHKLAGFEQRWQQPTQRRAFRLATVVWGLTLLGEFALRLVLVLSLPITLAVTLTTFLPLCIYAAVLAWTVWYMRHISPTSLA